jgi:MFS superfamily sulfate permease-like transporter
LYSLRLGVVCTLLSDALVSSFITGAGVHIFTSQIKEVVGLKVAKFKGPFYMLYVSAKHAQRTNQIKSRPLIADLQRYV